MGYRTEEVDEASASLRQAESAGRPTPDLVAGLQFSMSRGHGYDPGEVDDFLDRVQNHWQEGRVVGGTVAESPGPSTHDPTPYVSAASDWHAQRPRGGRVPGWGSQGMPSGGDFAVPTRDTRPWWKKLLD